MITEILWKCFSYWLPEQILPMLQMEMLGPKCTPDPGSQSMNSHFKLLSSLPSPLHVVNSYTTFKMAQASPPAGSSLTTHLDSSSIKDPGLWSLYSPSIIIIQDLPCPYPSLFEGLILLHPSTPSPSLSTNVFCTNGIFTLNLY